MNRRLTRSQRHEVIERGIALARATRELRGSGAAREEVGCGRRWQQAGLACPLAVEGRCLLFTDRPLRCRCWGVPEQAAYMEDIRSTLAALSRNVYLALTGSLPPRGGLRFTIADTVSGRFVQLYFQSMLQEDGKTERG